MKFQGGKREERTEEDNGYDLIECRRTSLFEGGVPKHPSNNCLGN